MPESNAPQSLNLPVVIGSQGAVTYSVDGTLNQGFIVVSGSGQSALLPLLDSVPTGFTFTIINATSGTFDVNPQPGEEVNGANSATVAARTTATLIKALASPAKGPLWFLG